MSLADSPFQYGDYWLDKRRDGQSPDTWQIAWKRGRSVAYRSTRQRDLEKAKATLVAHATTEKTKAPANDSEANVISLLRLYWLEHGRDVVSPDQIASSIRVFVGFLVSEKDLGPTITVDRLKPEVFERFRRWRMGKHSWAVRWEGKVFAQTSFGVKGETIKRNLEDIGAAMHHNERMQRIRAPYIPPVPKTLRSPPREKLLTLEELGAIIGYARNFPGFYRWVALMLATTVRPEAGLAFKPSKQWRGNAVDLHPADWPLTKKVNPVVPAIKPLQGLMEDWQEGVEVNSRKRAWRTMRRVLGLDADVFPKTIRHTVATMLLDDSDVTPVHIEALLGHRIMSSTTAVYAKWNVRHLEPVRAPLERIWDAVHQAADQWAAVHLLSSGAKGKLQIEEKQLVFNDLGG
jgi:integrase